MSLISEKVDPPPRKEKSPQPHIAYVAVGRAQSDKPDPETGYENIVLTHPLLPADFEIPERRKQVINQEYERLRRLEDAAMGDTDMEALVDDNNNNIGEDLVQGESSDLQSSLRNMNVAPLYTYSNMEEAIIRNAFRRDRDEQQILANTHGIPISRATLRCLDKNNWVEDDIIGYIFSIWNARATHNGSRNLFVGTFFMDMLQANNSYNFLNVRGCFNDGIDIIDDTIMYIPVNIRNTHWTLLVIDMLTN